MFFTLAHFPAFFARERKRGKGVARNNGEERTRWNFLIKVFLFSSSSLRPFFREAEIPSARCNGTYQGRNSPRKQNHKNIFSRYVLVLQEKVWFLVRFLYQDQVGGSSPTFIQSVGPSPSIFPTSPPRKMGGKWEGTNVFKFLSDSSTSFFIPLER